MSKPLSGGDGPACEIVPDGAAFYAGLHDGMHAMAQPITLLRSYFYLAQAGGWEGFNPERLLEDAAAGVEHLCVLFRIMQDLVHVHSAASHVSAVPFSSVLVSLAEDAEVVFAGTKLQLRLQAGQAAHRCIASMPVILNVDPKRTRQALWSMLHIAASAAGKDSAISCSFVLDGCWAELIFTLDGPTWGEPEAHFDEVTRLHLALVKANSLRQRAIFRFEGKPFTLSIKFPLVPEQA